MSTTTLATPDFTAIKGRQQLAWLAGDYAVIGGLLVITAELLCEAVDLRAGQHVLDVATGSGNIAIAAARRWCDVTGIDYAPALLNRARERAAAERLPVVFADGDAENIPFAGASYDVVLSTFGVMFAPDQEQAARELLRVCRPGGTIGLANWTPDGFIGQMFRTIGSYVAPPVGVRSPMLWGDEQHLRGLFGDGAASLTVNRRSLAFRFRSPEHWLATFRGTYGPLLKSFETLDTARQSELAHELLALWQRYDRGGEAGSVVDSEYLEVVIRKA